MRTIVAMAGFILLASCAGPAAQTPAGTVSDAPLANSSSATTPSPTEPPTSTPEAPTPSTTPSPESSPTAGLVVEGMARVIADAVVVREAPGRQSAFVQLNCYLGPAPCGQLLFGKESGYESVYLLDGPVAADGYDWYLAATDRVDALYPEYIGWIPAGDAAGPWVVGAPPDCPQEPIELADLTYAAISFLARLDCVGGVELTLRGWFPAPPPPDGVSSETCLPIEGQPGFCAFGWDMLRPVEGTWAGDANHLEFKVATAAGLTQPARPAWITVRGQFDHPGSSECYERDIRAVLGCRLQFVVTDILSE